MTNTFITWLWTALLIRTITSITWHTYKSVFIDVSSFAKYVILLSVLDFVYIQSALPPELH